MRLCFQCLPPQARLWQPMPLEFVRRHVAQGFHSMGERDVVAFMWKAPATLVPHAWWQAHKLRGSTPVAVAARHTIVSILRAYEELLVAFQRAYGVKGAGLGSAGPGGADGAVAGQKRTGDSSYISLVTEAAPAWPQAAGSDASTAQSQPLLDADARHRLVVGAPVFVDASDGDLDQATTTGKAPKWRGIPGPLEGVQQIRVNATASAAEPASAIRFVPLQAIRVLVALLSTADVPPWVEEQCVRMMEMRVRHPAPVRPRGDTHVLM